MPRRCSTSLCPPILTALDLATYSEVARIKVGKYPQRMAAVAGNPIPENMVVAALDDVDGVDLHVTEMLDGCRRRGRSLAERLARVEPLGAQPDLAGLGLGQGDGFIGAGHRAAI